MRGFRNNFNANNSTDLAEIPEGSKNQSLDNSGSTPPEPPDGLTGEEPPELTDGSIQPPEEMENGNSDNLPEISPNQNMEDNQNETNQDSRDFSNLRADRSGLEENTIDYTSAYYLIGISFILLLIAFGISFIFKGKYG